MECRNAGDSYALSIFVRASYDDIPARVRTDTPDFQANRAANLALLLTLKERIARVQLAGGERAIARHRARNKLLARERIDLLVDSGTAFLEMSPLAGWDMYDDEAPSGGIITGIRVVHGQEVVVVANDATVKGGTYFPITVKNICGRKKSPCKIICPVSIWWIPAEPICPCKRRSFPIRMILVGSSTTKPPCLLDASLKYRP
jgi:hypothetical protein